MAVKLVLTAKGADVSKQFTIPNPIPVEDFNSDNAEAFVANWANEYGSDVALAKAAYVTTTESVVYPEP